MENENTAKYYFTHTDLIHLLITDWNYIASIVIGVLTDINTDGFIVSEKICFTLRDKIIQFV